MPNSLKCKIKHLRHNGTLTEREYDRILKALEQQPCEDCISRQEAIRAIQYEYYDHAVGIDIVDIVAHLPSVIPKAESEQEPKTGKWTETSLTQVSGGDFNRGFKCSCCDYVTVVDDFNYCPNCGAKMEAEA